MAPLQHYNTLPPSTTNKTFVGGVFTVSPQQSCVIPADGKNESWKFFVPFYWPIPEHFISDIGQEDHIVNDTANPITCGTQHWPLLSCWLGEMHWTASWRWREYWCMLLGWSWAGTVPALVTGDGSGQRPKKLYYIQTTTQHCSTTHSCLRSWLSFTQHQDKNLPNSAIVIIPLFGCAINISQQPNNYHRKNF